MISVTMMQVSAADVVHVIAVRNLLAGAAFRTATARTARAINGRTHHRIRIRDF